MVKYLKLKHIATIKYDVITTSSSPNFLFSKSNLVILVLIF